MARRIGYVAYYAADLEALASQNERLSTCDRVFTDELKRSDDERHELAAALAALVPGDVLVVTDLAILAKSLPHLGRVLAAVCDRGAGLSVSSGIPGDPTPMSAAEIEAILATIRVHTSLSQQRALDGARRTGVPNGRPPVLDDAGKRRMRNMLRQGRSQAEICRELGISRTSAFRYRRELEAAAELAVV